MVPYFVDLQVVSLVDDFLIEEGVDVKLFIHPPEDMTARRNIHRHEGVVTHVPFHDHVPPLLHDHVPTLVHLREVIPEADLLILIRDLLVKAILDPRPIHPVAIRPPSSNLIKSRVFRVDTCLSSD